MYAINIEGNITLIKKALHFSNYFNKKFGDAEIALLAVTDGSEVGFLGIKNKNAYYINDSANKLKLLEFGFDDNWSLEHLIFDEDVFVFDDEAVCFQNKDNYIEELRCLNLESRDNSGYNGRIMYSQINSANNTNLELHYAFNYYLNERLGHPYIYKNKVENPTYIFLTDDNRLGYYKLPGIGKRYNYYALYTFDSDFAYSFLSEKKGEEDRTIRYVRLFSFYNSEFSDIWPLSGSKSKEEMENLISEYHFRSQIPQKLLDMYNHDDDDYKLACELIKIIKQVMLNKEKEKQAKLILSK